MSVLSRVRGGLAVIAVLSLGLGAIVVTPEAAQAGNGAGQVVTNKTGYGPNEAIYASGAAVFMQGCKTRSGRPGIGVDDVFQTWSDLYVVPAGSVSSGGALVDVNMLPNVVFGGMAGGFVEQVIGYTGPGFQRIPAGTYDIVLDECQDGFLDPEDTIIRDAFTVTIPLGTESAVIPGVNKFASAARAAGAASLAAAWKKLLKSTGNKKIGPVSMTISMDMSVAIVNGMMGTSLPDPRNAGYAALLQLARAHAGLAADPPDPAFQQHATPVIEGASESGTAIPDAVYGDPIEALLIDASRSAEIDAALIAALVGAIEKHQGAAAVGNGDWMAQHAREALALLDVLASRADSTPDLFEALADAWGSSDATSLRQAVNIELQRARYYERNGPHARNDHRDGLNRGADTSDVAAFMADISDSDELYGILTGSPSALSGLLRDEAAAHRDALTGFADLRTDLERSLTDLAAEERDAPRPVAVLAAPTGGETHDDITLDASGSTNADGTSDDLDFAWDLDLDGVFDDGAGAITETAFTVPGDRVVAVRVTDKTGATAVAYTVVPVTDNNTAPTIAATSQPAVAEVDPGGSFALEVTVSDADGDAVEVTWMQEGTDLGQTGTTFTGTAPTTAGTTVRYDAVATDEHGARSMQPFLVTVFGADEDGDGWRLPADCDDTNAQVNPARSEVRGNGLDDDCNPETSDEPQAPRNLGFTLNSDLTPSTGLQEGDLFAIALSGWTHDQRSSGNPFTVRVDWGDGTVTEEIVAGGSYQETIIRASHVYTGSGPYSVTLCVTDPDGLTGCNTRHGFTGRILPAPPVIHPANLEAWSIEQSGRTGDPAVGGTGKWLTAPGGFSAIQMSNINHPTVLLSDYALDTSDGPRRVAFDFGTAYALDDDFIGFVLGLQPGKVNDDGADWIAVRFDGHLESFRTDQKCGGTPVDHAMDNPMSIIRYTGYGHWYEYTGGTTLRIPDATNPLCNDDMGAEVLASGKLPEGLGYGTGGTYRRISHPAEISANDKSKRPQLYHAEVEYSAEQLRVWVDGQLMFDIDAPAGNPFPQGHVGLFSQSQPATRLIGHQAVPTRTVIQGTTETFSVELANADPATSHTAVIDWGDGTPASAAQITPVPGKSGFWTISAEHAYQRLGTFFANVCATDATDQQIGCGLIEITVENAPPVVEAGLDSTTLSRVELHGAHFTDPGMLDTHTATVDWGDGTAPETVLIDGRPGSGILTAAHDYASAGEYVIEVCVTDMPANAIAGTADAVTAPRPAEDPSEYAATVCDTATATVIATLEAPTTLVTEDQHLTEGDIATIGVGFEEATAGATHTVTVDWGDGATEEQVQVQDGGTAGSGWATHRFLDNGTYTVTVTTESAWTSPTPDATPQTESSTKELTIVVDNADPVLQVGSDRTTTGTLTLTNVLVTDAGVLDTHTATVDWGDGSDPEPLTVTPLEDSDGATLTGAHEYSSDGTYTVTITVTDNDGGSTAATFTVTVTQEAPAITIDAPETLTGVEGDQILLEAVVHLNEGVLGSGDTSTDTESERESESESETTLPESDDATEPSAGTSQEDSINEEEVSDELGELSEHGEPGTGDGVNTPVILSSFENLTATIDWGDGSTPEPVALTGSSPTRTLSVHHAYADNGTYIATIRVCLDETGNECVATTVLITVSNADPVIETLNADLVDGELRTVRLILTYTDPGTADTHTGVINWGDGTLTTVGPPPLLGPLSMRVDFF